MDTKKKILLRINELALKAFTTADFLDLDNYKMISKSLELLEDENEIVRARRGLYYPYKKNELLGIVETPDVIDLAYAIARQYNLTIVPSGNFALNLIGLSTQVPSNYVFITDGAYKKYLIGKTEISFKHSTSKEVTGLSYKNLVVIQAIKHLKKENINEEVRKKINSFLDESDKNQLKKNEFKITAWIYEELLKIINGEQSQNV